ncbi:MAG: TlpA disulfide reductase family protein [Eubacteriaceae bacterium]|nr:TlpA disulfide reductase family protein [Eubacteriaceae bacterium]
MKKEIKIAIGIVAAIAIVIAAAKISGAVNIGGKCSDGQCGTSYSERNSTGSNDSSSANNSEASDTSSETKTSTNGPIFGDFNTTDVTGEKVDQTIFEKSNLTMVNIWATYCSPCLEEMPALQELSDKYKGKMQIVGIVSDISKANDKTASKIIKEKKIKYTNLVPSSDMYYLSQVQYVPTTVFLDKDGNQIGESYSGSKDRSSWDSLIKKMLDEVNSK